MENICGKTKRFPSPYSSKSVVEFQIRPQGGILLPVKSIVDTWFAPHELVTDFKWIEKFNIDQDAPWKQINTFTHMISDEAHAIGCSILRNDTHMNIVCVFNAGNSITSIPVYEVGQMGSECITGMNTTYPGLCSINEYFVDNIESPLVSTWIENEKTLDTSTWTMINDRVNDRLDDDDSVHKNNRTYPIYPIVYAEKGFMSFDKPVKESGKSGTNNISIDFFNQITILTINLIIAKMLTFLNFY